MIQMTIPDTAARIEGQNLESFRPYLSSVSKRYGPAIAQNLEVAIKESLSKCPDELIEPGMHLRRIIHAHQQTFSVRLEHNFQETRFTE